jgi:L-lactate dehydrogenase complex protein LldF
MMRHWREREFERHQQPAAARAGLKLWAFLARRPALYRIATAIPMRVLGALGKRRGRFASLPLAGGWTSVRDLPAPSGETFHTAWRRRQRRAQR